MNQQHTSIVPRRSWLTAGAASLALFAACGQSSTNDDIASQDTSGQYAALSASLQQCNDDHAACTTAAAGDDSKIASCDKQAAECKANTSGAERAAHQGLRGAVETCAEQSHCDAASGGSSGSCRPAFQQCLADHAPPLPPCLEDLFTCVKNSGVSTSQTQLSDQTKAALGQCIDTAHTCFMDAIETWRQQAGAAGGRSFPGLPRAGAGSFPGFGGHPALPERPHHDRAGQGGASGSGN